MRLPRPLFLVGGALALVVIVVVGAAIVWTLRSDDPNLLTEAPAIPTEVPAGADVSPTGVPTETSQTVSDVDLPEGVRRFVVVSGDSSAKYVVEETLSGLPATAVGVSTDVTGEIYLTEDGLYDGMESSLLVDLSTLETDESRRDNYVRNNTLETDQYQYAAYVIESIDAFPTGYVEGEEAALTLTGTMTIKDVSLPITFTVLARQAGDTLTATADTEFLMSDFGIDPPSVAIASARDGVVLQVVIIAREPAS